MRELFRGSMQGRTLYVVPYCMGPIDSPYARCGVEITDSAYVVLNMAIMTRMGRAALERIATEGTFVRGLHSVGELDPDRRFIMHFPEDLVDRELRFGLRRQCAARQEVPCAAHRELAGASRGLAGRAHAHRRADQPAGRDPLRRCGVSIRVRQDQPRDADPAGFAAGWKVHTIGDDIAWLQPGADGRLWAMNPESGYFGVVPGTNPKTNRNAYEMIRRDTLFTNVALTADNEPWWEGRIEGTPAIDWLGRPYDPATDRPRTRIRASPWPRRTIPHTARPPRIRAGCRSRR